MKSMPFLNKPLDDLMAVRLFSGLSYSETKCPVFLVALVNVYLFISICD